MTILETPSRIEPVLFGDTLPAVLANLSVDIQRESSELGKGFHASSTAELADFVRIMNCYYSNLIEGHNTRPKDIELALSGAEIEPDRRSLALEARAHVEVQRKIDFMHRNGTLPSPTSGAFILWLHEQFFLALPDELRFVTKSDGTKIDIIPGSFRTESYHDVTVGRHTPPSSHRVADFMAWFEKRFQATDKQSSMQIVAIACAHHRFNYVHPFVDGNGRVSRLMSHAMGLKAGVGGHGLWSISRGLSRGLKDSSEYKMMMDNADSPRRSDRDGRGNLSENALIEFTEWFLLVCLDQVRFAKIMFDLDRLEDRYRGLIIDAVGDRRAPDLISAVLKNGSLARGDVNYFLKASERTARTTLGELVELGFLKSDTPKSAVRIAFPIDYRERLFPNLFTDAEVYIPEPPSRKFR